MRLIEVRVIRSIFVPKREELTGECRKLHNEEINHLYASPQLMGLIKSGRM